MQTPSSLRVVLTQVPRPEAPADDRPGVEKALREDTTKEAGASKHRTEGMEGFAAIDSSGWPECHQHRSRRISFGSQGGDRVRVRARGRVRLKHRKRLFEVRGRETLSFRELASPCSESIPIVLVLALVISRHHLGNTTRHFKETCCIWVSVICASCGLAFFYPFYCWIAESR
jgi:hypothetical protein